MDRGDVGLQSWRSAVHKVAAERAARAACSSQGADDIMDGFSEIRNMKRCMSEEGNPAGLSSCVWILENDGDLSLPLGLALGSPIFPSPRDEA